MSKFIKGQSGNPSGRPKGTKNKTNEHLRTMIGDFLTDAFPKMVEEFDNLDPHQQHKLFTDLLTYGLPKLSSVSMGVQYDNMTDKELQQIIEGLTAKAIAEDDNPEI